MKRVERGWTKLASAHETSDPFAVVGARHCRARQPNSAFPRHWAGPRGPKGHESPVTNHYSRITIYSPSARHKVSSSFLANSLKTKKSGPACSTHKSRGRELHFPTLNLFDPPNLGQAKVSY
jgi:hypothetical protein